MSENEPKPTNRRGENTLGDLGLLRGIIAEVDKTRGQNKDTRDRQTASKKAEIPEEAKSPYEPYPAPEDLKEYEEFLDCYLKGMTDYYPVFIEKPKKLTFIRNIVRKTINNNLGPLEPVDSNDRIINYNEYLAEAFEKRPPSELESMFRADVQVDGLE